MKAEWKENYVNNALQSIAKIQKCGDGTDLSDEKKKLEHLFSEKVLNKPKKLYKYIATVEENNVKDICEGKILLKNRESLNDPFDGIFTLKRMNEDEVLESDYKIAQEKKDKYIKSFKTVEQWKTFAKQYPNLITKGLQEQYNEYDKINTIIKRNSCVAGSSSFSEVNPKEKYNLLWSHYADKGKGLCFEYDTQDNLPIFIQSIHPVFYNDTLYQLHQKDWEREKILIYSYIALCWKLKIWDYEKEWRYLNYKPIFKNESHREEFKARIPNIEQNSYIGQYIVENDRIKPSKVYFIKDISAVDRNMLERMNIEVEELNLYNF